MPSLFKLLIKEVRFCIITFVHSSYCCFVNACLLFLLLGIKSFLHLPALQCYSLECWRLLLLCISNSCHVGHFNHYLTVHNQKGGFEPEFSVTFHPAFLSAWTLLLLLQQYVMLHDMVAAHSVLRVSVCRGNQGGHHKATHSISPETFFLWFLSSWVFCSCRNWTGHVHRARAWWCHLHSSQWDGDAVRRRAPPGNLYREWEHADRLYSHVPPPAERNSIECTVYLPKRMLCSF